MTRLQGLGIGLVFLLCLSVSGCASSRTMKAETESRQDVEQAIESIAGAVTGQELSDEDAKRLNAQIRRDPETRDAIKTIADSFNTSTVRVKYCPKTGNRFAPHLEICPEHNVPLELVEE